MKSTSAALLLSVFAAGAASLQAQAPVVQFDGTFDTDLGPLIGNLTGSFSLTVDYGWFDSSLPAVQEKIVGLDHWSMTPGVLGATAMTKANVQAYIAYDPTFNRIKNIIVGAGTPNSALSFTDDFFLSYFWQRSGWVFSLTYASQTQPVNTVANDFTPSGTITEGPGKIVVPGESPDSPVLPSIVDAEIAPWELPEIPFLWGENFIPGDQFLIDGTPFQFDNIASGVWSDPVPAHGFLYQGIEGTEFTGILGFAPGFGSAYEIYVNNYWLGTFSEDATVDFVELTGSSVSSFVLLGINPAVDGDDPEAFPIQLTFASDVGSFRQFALTQIPEPSTYAAWLGLGMLALGVARRARRA